MASIPLPGDGGALAARDGGGDGVALEGDSMARVDQWMVWAMNASYSTDWQSGSVGSNECDDGHCRPSAATCQW